MAMFQSNHQYRTKPQQEQLKCYKAKRESIHNINILHFLGAAVIPDLIIVQCHSVNTTTVRGTNISFIIEIEKALLYTVMLKKYLQPSLIFFFLCIYVTLKAN